MPYSPSLSGSLGPYPPSPYHDLAPSPSFRLGQGQDSNGNCGSETEDRPVDNSTALRDLGGYMRLVSHQLETESQLLDVETRLTETFTESDHQVLGDDGRERADGESIDESLSSGGSESREQEEAPQSLDIYSEHCERAFESLQDMVVSPSSPTSSSSSGRSRGKVGQERKGEPKGVEEIHKKSW